MGGSSNETVVHRGNIKAAIRAKGSRRAIGKELIKS
jgi:hypothetical protein